jgi:F420-dependent oxidoreductase-like protein
MPFASINGSEEKKMGEQLSFGICTDQNLPWPVLAEQWRRYEALGFDSIWDCDHLYQPSKPTGPYFEAWTVLAALATQTERVRIGVLVTCNTFRHPGLLAKEAVTVDHVSNGRLEIGLGAGWFVPEHERFGIPFPSPSELVGRFREAVEIIDGMLRNELSTYDGHYYQLHDAPSRPGPVQRPRPPLLLAGKGPRMLKIVAQYADAWNSSGSVDEVRVWNQTLDENCAAIGRDPSAIRRGIYGWAAKLPADPWASVGAFEQVIGDYRAVGVNEFIIDMPREDQPDVLERVAIDVLPALRASST